MYDVVIAYDDEAGVFYVERSDIHGLHVEAKTIQEMIDIIDDVVPDLIRANHPPRQTAWQRLLKAVHAPAPDARIHYNITKNLCLDAA